MTQYSHTRAHIMDSGSVWLLFVLSLFFHSGHAAEKPKAMVTLTPASKDIFRGESVTLRCDVPEWGNTGVDYRWYFKRSYQPGQEYIISSADYSHSGDYSCIALQKSSSRWSDESDKVKLTVSERPKLTLTLNPSWTVFSGESISLTCSIQGESPSDWRYSWYRRGQQVYPQTGWSDRNEYRLQSVQENHSGDYSCRGSRRKDGKFSQESDDRTLTVSVLPTPTLTVTPESPVFTGETVTLRCEIESYSGWTYKWYKDGSYRAEGDTFTLKDISQSHGGKYWCQGERSGGVTSSQISSKTIIEVEERPKPTLTLNPSWTPVFSGESISLTCSIQGESPSDWRYSWYRRGQQVYPKTGWSDSNEYRLQSVQENHSGDYSCRGSRQKDGKYSQESDDRTLTVSASKPKLTSSPGDLLLTGDSVTLRCVVGVSSGLVFYWYRGTHTSDAGNQTDRNSYSISSVKVSDGAQYWCRAKRRNPVYYTQYSDAVEIKVTERPKAVITLKSNWTEFFSREQISLRCGINGGESRGWEYSWFRDGTLYRYRQQPVINLSEGGSYTCKGQIKYDTKESEESDSVFITISYEKAQAVLSSLSQPWLTEGNSVTLSCGVKGSTTGWRFHWYKTAPYMHKLQQVTYESRKYHIEPVSNSIRESGGSYTLSSAALRHSGVYVCRAERGEPAYHTEFSQPQPLWVTGVFPKASVNIHSNWTQIFTFEPVSLSCGVQGNSAGWRLRWFTGRGEESKCPTDWRSETASICSIGSTSSLDSGVYWCQSDSGEQSNPVNVTVHDGNVILEVPAHPVNEGDPLTLCCRHRYQPSVISADFYKDGTLLQTSSTGEMTIPAVSKSHEGLYKCNDTARGESPESWITVRVSDSGSSILGVAVGVVIGLLFAFALVILLVLLYCSHKTKGSVSVTPSTGQQHSNSQISTSQQKVVGGSVAAPSNVVYAEIDLKRDTESKKKGAKAGATVSDTLYSHLKPVRKPADPSDVTYADIQIDMKPLKGKAKPKSTEEENVYSAVKPGYSSDASE